MNRHKDFPGLTLGDVLHAEPRLQLAGYAGAQPDADAPLAGLLTYAESAPDTGDAGAAAEAGNIARPWLISATPADGELAVLVRSRPHAAAFVWFGPPPAQTHVSGPTRDLPPVFVAGEGLTHAELRACVDAQIRKQPNIREWRRLSAVEALSSALATANPEQEMLARYAALTGEAALIVTLDGDIRASVGELPARSIVRTLIREAGTELSYRSGRWALRAIQAGVNPAVQVGGETLWVVRGRRNDRIPDAAAPAAIALRDVLGTLVEARRHHSQDRVMGSTEILLRLTRLDANKDGLAEALERRGFSGRAQLRLIHAGTVNEVHRQEFLMPVTAAAEREMIPLLAGYVDGRIAVLVADGPGVDAVVGALPAPVGVSACFSSRSDGVVSWREARVAAAIAGVDMNKPVDNAQNAGDSASVFFEACGAAARAAAQLGSLRLGECVASLDAALEGIKEAQEVLTAWVQEEFSIPRAAKRLGRHANTVRNRLDEISQVYPLSMADAQLWYLWRIVDAPRG
ncbi:helix-turn-helix domain-containing protein [Corynebacterium sp.]|uniref:helix-turn-helix domain-containing protein n=1 Tax=Corynebacterium sp. TaxID=1720 RepID=UPI0026DD3F6F|nr:helix-turn-helix domain-containing protein [Corynebacterium sp.]MDO5032133.1 helix-turn-helix domain-containing protein [Corynebacterium sp.]